MAKKTKSGSNGKKIHLCDISNCVALVLGWLQLYEIVRASRVSKWFGSKSCEALGLVTVYDHEAHGMDRSSLSHLLAYCRNIEAITNRLMVINTSEVFGAIQTWRNLKEIRLEYQGVNDDALQRVVIPKIAELAPNLEILALTDLCVTAKIYLAPLATLKRLRALYFYLSDTEGHALVGMENVLRNCPISHLGVDECCDLFAALNPCNTTIFERMEELILYKTDVTAEDCTTLGRMVNLETLQLSSDNISNDGIRALSSLQHLDELTMSFEKLTPRGMSFLTGRGRFPSLTKVKWSGDLPFDQQWLEVLEQSHDDLVVEYKD